MFLKIVNILERKVEDKPKDFKKFSYRFINSKKLQIKCEVIQDGVSFYSCKFLIYQCLKSALRYFRKIKNLHTVEFMENFNDIVFHDVIACFEN